MAWAEAARAIVERFTPAGADLDAVFDAKAVVPGRWEDVVDVPPTLFSGQVYLRAGNSAITRADMTAQDGYCSYAGPGSWSCPFNIPRGQTVTLVANDQQSQISFGTHTVLQRNLDPRGIRSQFAGFSGPCNTTERGVCVFTASSDLTITAQYTALTWTRVNLVGLNNWRITIDAPPVLSLWGNQRPPDQHEVWPNGVNPIAACATDTDPVHCYSILTPATGTIQMEALPPVGPLPQGAIGPLEFVGYDGACQINGANPNCPLTSGVDQVAVMKWEYYRCGAVDVPNGATNSIWKYPPGYLTGCRLVRP